MTDDRADRAFRLARSGDQEAFAEWMGMIEIPLRRSLQRYARAVDVEVVVQEALMRMWLVARDPARVLEGSNAPIKFAIRVARNVALEEVRRYRHELFVGLDELDHLPQGRVAPDPPDPALARAIKDCMESLPEQPRKALSGRVRDGGLPDREIAAALRMKINTFLQNVVRARRLLRKCLDRRGVRLGEILP